MSIVESCQVTETDIPLDEFNLCSFSSEIIYAKAKDGFLLTFEELMDHCVGSCRRHFYEFKTIPTIDIELTPQNDSTLSVVSKKHKNNRYHRLYNIAFRIKGVSYQNDINWS